MLVWAFPPPSSEHDASYDIVHVKLADYGISTFAPFGLASDLGDHTARYTAPEILQYGCKASYNASVRGQQQQQKKEKSFLSLSLSLF